MKREWRVDYEKYSDVSRTFHAYMDGILGPYPRKVDVHFFRDLQTNEMVFQLESRR